jgi:CRP/FNR family transcriptional regulator
MRSISPARQHPAGVSVPDGPGPACADPPMPDPCAHCDARLLSVCSALEERDLHRLAALAEVMAVAPGETFIAEGERAEHFFNVTGGTARLYKLLPDGRRQITGFARPGHFLGLAVSEANAFSAEALEPVRLCRFSRSRLRLVLEDFPAFERRLLRTAANELVAAQEQMLLLGRKTARERVASFLLAQLAASRPCEASANGFRLPMTRTDIADYLGLTIETVSRVFSQFRRKGMIALPTAQRVELRDRDALEAASGDCAI